MLVVGVLAGPTILSCADSGRNIAACATDKIRAGGLFHRLSAPQMAGPEALPAAPLGPGEPAPLVWIEAAAAPGREIAAVSVSLSPQSGRLSTAGHSAAPPVKSGTSSLSPLPRLASLSPQPANRGLTAAMALSPPPAGMLTGSVIGPKRQVIMLDLMPEPLPPLAGIVSAMGRTGNLPPAVLASPLRPTGQMAVETPMPPAPLMRAQAKLSAPLPQAVTSMRILSPDPAMAAIQTGPLLTPPDRTWGANPDFPSVTYLEPGAAGGVTDLTPPRAAPSVVNLP